MSNTLEHVGILGMRWGRRKSSSSSDIPTKKYSDDHKVAESLRTKKLHEMSNAEIRTLATRLQLEQQYNQLNPDKITRGKKQVRSALNNVKFATESVAALTTAYLFGKKVIDYATKPETIAKINDVVNKVSNHIK